MKVVSVMGKCSKTKRNIGLQFIVDGNSDYKVGGTYVPSSAPSSDAADESKGANALYHGTFTKVGCPVCGNKYLFVCRNCGTLNCYNGKSGKVVCASCNKEVEVECTSDDRILPSVNKDGGPVAVMLAIDVSGSMSGSPLDDMKRAAKESYLTKLGKNVEVGLVLFSSSVVIDCSLTKNKSDVIRRVDSLSAGGGTHGPLCYIRDRQECTSFRNFKGKRYVVLFTDGEWFDPQENKEASRDLQAMGIEIIGIATTDADTAFIKSISNGSMIIERGQESAAFDFVLKQTKGNG